jgi:hypothetical protein
LFDLNWLFLPLGTHKNTTATATATAAAVAAATEVQQWTQHTSQNTD